MSTRQGIQVALDLVRFGNIMNDLIDVASYYAHEIDPETELILIRLGSVGEEEPGETSGEGKLGIKGPIARRGLAYVPPIPKVKTTVETQFEIEFWVRPDGAVDRVI